MHNHPVPDIRRHRLTRSLAGALAVAAIAAPAAGAQPWHNQGPGEGANPPDHATPVVTRTIGAGGFDADSVALGAGVAAALVLAVSGAAASRRRHRLRVHH